MGLAPPLTPPPSPDMGSASESTCFCPCCPVSRVTSPQVVGTLSRPFCTSPTGDPPPWPPTRAPVLSLSRSLPAGLLRSTVLPTSASLPLPHPLFSRRTLCRGEYSILHRLKAASECWGWGVQAPDPRQGSLSSHGSGDATTLRRQVVLGCGETRADQAVGLWKWGVAGTGLHQHERAPVTSSPPPCFFQWGQRGGTICPSVGCAPTESWAGTRSQSSSISTARCSSRMTGRSSLVSPGSGPLAARGGGAVSAPGPAGGDGGMDTGWSSGRGSPPGLRQTRRVLHLSQAPPTSMTVACWASGTVSWPC